MRKEYELSDEEVASLETTRTPSNAQVVVWVTECKDPMYEVTKQLNALWIKIGKAHGFDGMTARPIKENYEDFKHLTAESYDA